jgi:hypothetical protein
MIEDCVNRFHKVNNQLGELAPVAVLGIGIFFLVWVDAEDTPFYFLHFPMRIYVAPFYFSASMSK